MKVVLFVSVTLHTQILKYSQLRYDFLLMLFSCYIPQYFHKIVIILITLTRRYILLYSAYSLLNTLQKCELQIRNV
jgi:hypothetical protein